MEARDIARGAAAGREGFKKIDFPEPKPEICKETYIFNSDGHANINTVGYWTVTGISLFIMLVAIPIDDERLLPEVPLKWLFGYGDPDHEDGIVIQLCKAIARSCTVVAGRIRGWRDNMREWLEDRRGWLEDWAFWRRS